MNTDWKDILYVNPCGYVNVMTTDGITFIEMWYSSGYQEWNHISDNDTCYEPTHWMCLEKYERFKRENAIDSLLS